MSRCEHVFFHVIDYTHLSPQSYHNLSIDFIRAFNLFAVIFCSMHLRFNLNARNHPLKFKIKANICTLCTQFWSANSLLSVVSYFGRFVWTRISVKNAFISFLCKVIFTSFLHILNLINTFSIKRIQNGLNNIFIVFKCE